MHRTCPEWFQERLAKVGGLNPYGEPRFKLVWGESEFMRVGGYFSKDGFVGYRWLPAVGNEKCWAILMWEPADMCGTAYRWYKDYRDEQTHLCTLGQYPYSGRYRVMKKLIHREFVGSNLVTVRLEPTHFILDIMIPMIMGWNKLTNVQRLKVITEEQEREEEKADKMLDDARHGARIRRGSPLIQKRLEQMERNMTQAVAIATRTRRGMTQIGA